MTRDRLKFCYFALTGLNTYATTCFFNYLVFFLHDRFGFGNRENLWVSALYGFIYIFSAWQCGRFAERRGYLLSLKIGFGSLALLMGAALLLLNSVIGILCMLAGYSIVLLFTWPALEALVTENETQAGVKHNVGIYNCTWAVASSLAYFTCGKFYDTFGRNVVFWLPAAIFVGEFLFVLWLERISRTTHHAPRPEPETPAHPEPTAFHQSVPPKTFLKMGWLANPFAYVAIQTVFAVMPGVAEKLGLSPTKVGLFCSVWLFARLGVFALLWQWDGWHYRFRWLVSAYVILVGSFMLLLLASQLWLVILAQIFFGFGTGLIYYSSLFYSMDVGETKGEHGGLHEAAIGAGIFAGPAVGAAALQFLPQHSSTGVFAVSILLLLGLAALLGVRWRAK